MHPGRPSLGRGSALLKLLQESRAGAEAPGSPASDSPFKAVSAAIAKVQLGPERQSETMPHPSDPEPVIEAASMEATYGAQSTSESTAEATAEAAPAQPDEDDLRQATVLKRGTAGSAVKLAANYVEVRQADGRCFAEYSVKMDPPVDEIK